MNRLTLFAVLLICALSIISVPEGFSQQSTTITTESTVTYLVSQTNSQPNPVSSYTTVNVVNQPILAYTWTHPGSGVRYCETSWENFSMTGEDWVGGTVMVNQPNTLTVFILSEAQYNAWSASRLCDPDYAQGSDWKSPPGVTATNVTWAAPQAGIYWILFQTYSDAPVAITANIYSQASQPATVILYSTSLSTYVQSVTQVLTSLAVQQVTQPLVNAGQVSLGGNAISSLLVAAVVIAIIALLVYLIVKRRKRA